VRALLAQRAAAKASRVELLARRLALEAGAALLGASLIAAGAKVKFFAPFTEVPFTLQTLSLTFVVLAMGRRAPTAVATYLALGLAGAPFFALGGGPWYVASPTFGYLLGFFAASFYGLKLGGKVASPAKLLTAVLAVMAVVYALGWSWLACWLAIAAGLRAGAAAKLALLQGVLPFAAWDLLKGFAALQAFIAFSRARSKVLAFLQLRGKQSNDEP